MDEEKTLPGEREKQEIDTRFREIYRYARVVQPLPEKYINNVEIKTYGNLMDAFAKFRKKEISKDTFGVIAGQIKKAHYEEYRNFDFYNKNIKEEQKRYMLLSQAVAGLIKCFEKMTDDERIDNLLKILGFVFTPQDEKVLRDKLAKAKDKPKKTGEKKAAFNIPEELKEAWNDFSEMRKEKRKPMTERAAELLYNRLMKIAGGDFETAKKMLEKSTRNAWTDVFPLDEDETRPKAANKQSVFGSDASYDISEFEKNNVGMKYLDEE